MALRAPLDAFGVRTARCPRRVDEEIRQRRIDAVANEPPHAGRIIVLPLGIDGQRDLGRPAGHGAGRQQNRIAHRLVAAAATIEHPRQHRHVQVGVVVDADLALAIVQAVQAADVLRNRPAPRNGQREKQGIQPRIVEPFADVSPRGEQDPLLVLGNGGQAGGDAAGLLGPRAAAEHDQVANARRQSSGQVVEMFVALGQHQGRTAFPDGLRRPPRRSADSAGRRRSVHR